MKQTFKEAGYQYLYAIKHTGAGKMGHVLLHNCAKELWYSNKNHASFGLIYKNTHLEFASTALTYSVTLKNGSYQITTVLPIDALESLYLSRLEN